MLAWLQNKIRQQSLWSLHKARTTKTCCFRKLRRWTFASEAARNIGPDTPEKKNSVIEEAKHVGAIFAARPCAGRGNVGVVAKQNPSTKSMEPAKLKIAKTCCVCSFWGQLYLKQGVVRKNSCILVDKCAKISLALQSSEMRWC